MRDIASTTGPIMVDGHDNLATLFRENCQKRGEATAHRVNGAEGWRDLSWADYYRAASDIGSALLSHDLLPGEVVLILSEDRPEWMYVDMGSVCARAITSGVYPTSSPEQLRYMLENSGARFLFVETAEQLAKFLAIEPDLPKPVEVIVMDAAGIESEARDNVTTLEDFYRKGAAYSKKNPSAFDQALDAIQPDDIATLIYTSGTTGPPKGVMLSHQNILAGMAAAGSVFGSAPGQHQICFLPLSHVMERLAGMWIPIQVGTIVSFAQSAKTVVDDLRDVRPHVFAAVPRVWEKIYAKVNAQISEAPAKRQKLFNTAVSDARRKLDLTKRGASIPLTLRLRCALWDKLVFSKIRAKLGLDRMQTGVSAAAPIPAEIIEWYTAIGLPILEAYGQTEITGISNANLHGDLRFGSVGREVAPVKVKLGADNEILFRGPAMFRGYWKMPEKTAETITDDGWLRSGDLGSIDPDGVLTITGRIKDIIVTAGGKNIAPAAIENAVKCSRYVADIMLVGEALPFITALVMIDQDVVDTLAHEEGIQAPSFKELAQHPRLRALIETDINKANEALSRVEQIKDFRVIEVELDPTREELTPTLKLRRDYVVRNHRDLIEQMYGSSVEFARDGTSGSVGDSVAPGG